jgi:hypothetical protein
MTGVSGMTRTRARVATLVLAVQLQSSVAATKANPTKGSLAAVRTSLELLRQSVGSLRATVGAGC